MDYEPPQYQQLGTLVQCRLRWPLLGDQDIDCSPYQIPEYEPVLVVTLPQFAQPSFDLVIHTLAPAVTQSASHSRNVIVGGGAHRHFIRGRLGAYSALATIRGCSQQINGRWSVSNMEAQA